MRITSLRINHLKNPLGYQLNPASFSWRAEGEEEISKEVSASLRLFEGECEIYSHKEEGALSSLDTPLSKDIKLKPRRAYRWQVSIEDKGRELAREEDAFETGKMKEAWIGKWISPEGETSSAILRKSFFIEKKERARLYICGLGLYECFINGRKAGDEYLAPGYHSYDFHLQTYTYDVTELLKEKEKENEISIFLGEGWFKGRLGFDGGYTNLYGDRLYAIAELYVGESGQDKCLLSTDETWKVCASPVILNNIYDGEIYDARRAGFMQSGKVCIKEPENCGPLTDRYSLPVKKKEVFAVKELLYTPKGDKILDFGQNITGWVEFDCSFARGTAITLTAGEILQNNEFYHDNMRTAKTQFTYISDGKKAHVRPHFTFFGFRYMKVDCKEDIRADMFRAFHLRSDFEQTGKIRTGHKKVNRLFLNAIWGMKDNFLDLPTDCPQRDERLGWTGDAQVISKTACYSFDMPAFYRKYLWDMRAEQSILKGAVPNVVPRLKKGMVAEYGSCPWADAAVIIPWNTYIFYGNKTLLAEAYPGMQGWVDYQRKKEEGEGGAHLIKSGFHFADWLALDNGNTTPFGATDPLYIASAYYYQCTCIVARAAEILGFSQAEDYKSLAAEILKALQKNYFDSEGLCLCRTQTGSALAICMGLSENPQKEGETLVKRIDENKGHLNTGFVGTPLICRALTLSGHHKRAVDLLLNEEYPGWLYSVNLGATTIWERWDSVLADGSINPEGMNSLNHYTYGSIAEWMFACLGGIEPKRAGFEEISIHPCPDKRLKFFKASLDTAAGRVESNWSYGQDKICYEIRIPLGVTARLCLPEEESVTLTGGSYVYERQEKEEA